jgi:hypothetical protein
MSAIQSLENAILERIRKQEAFKKEVKDALTRAFISLPECDSKDEVSNTININKDKFASLLEKLHNDKSLNREAVQQLIQSTNIKDLKRGSNSKSDLRLSDSYHTANGSRSEFSGSSPRPSDLDRLRFSDGSQSNLTLQPNLGDDFHADLPLRYEHVNPSIPNQAGNEKTPKDASEEFHYGGKRSKRTRRR